MKGKFLFNEFALAKVFRARFLEELQQAGLALPQDLPKKWVADCDYVGSGITALQYLSRYLYRGVISENMIVANRNGEVTFKYVESKSGDTKFRTVKGEEFRKIPQPFQVSWLIKALGAAPPLLSTGGNLFL